VKVSLRAPGKLNVEREQSDFDLFRRIDAACGGDWKGRSGHGN